MLGWLWIYCMIMAGLCWLAIRTSDEGGCVSGFILLIMCFAGLWTIGRIIVNPVNRDCAIAMIIINAAAIVIVTISLIKNR